MNIVAERESVESLDNRSEPLLGPSIEREEPEETNTNYQIFT